jgi:hypothetical protein
MFPPGLIHHRPDAPVPGDGATRSGPGGPSLVLTADPKPRLRWTADLHERFVDAVAQLGGPESELLPSFLPLQSGFFGGPGPCYWHWRAMRGCWLVHSWCSPWSSVGEISWRARGSGTGNAQDWDACTEIMGKF